MSDSVLDRVREFFTELGAVDTIALALLLFFLVRGAMKGFVWQVAGLVAVAGGLILARSFAPELAPKLASTFPGLSDEQGLDIVTAYFLIFVAVLGVVALMARLLKNLIDKLRLQSFDRVLGAVFGVVKAAALIVMTVSLLSVLPSELIREQLTKAKTGEYSKQVIERGEALFPDEVGEYLGDTLRRVQESLDGDESSTNAE